MNDSLDGFCPIHDTYLDDGYCVACLVSRLAALDNWRATILALDAELARDVDSWAAVRAGIAERHERLLLMALLRDEG